MGNIKVISGILGGVAIIAAVAALSVNLVPDDKANDKHLADYCAEMTRSLMKSPSSYKLDEYYIRELPLTRNELAEIVQMAPFNNIDDAIDNDKRERSKIEIIETYMAKNAMGVELVGNAICTLNKTNYGSAGSSYSIMSLSINDENIDDINLITAELAADKKTGRLNSKSDYMKKLNYIFN